MVWKPEPLQENESNSSYDFVTVMYDQYSGVNLNDPVNDPNNLLSLESNPVCGISRISVTVMESSSIDLQVFDSNGSLVEILHRGAITEGDNELTWHTSQVPAGACLLNAVIGYRKAASRLVVLN